MARPLKKDLEYFPLDVWIFRDDKIRDLNYHVGPLGELIYIRILTLVYENGYYLETIISRLAKILHKDLGPQWIKLERISMFIHARLEAVLFDDELTGQDVITFVTVQKQYLLSTVRRKDINIDKYWLLEPSESVRPADATLSLSKESVNDNNNIVNVSNNSVNANISTQSKSKRKIDKLINSDRRVYGKPKLHFITNVLIKNKFIEEDDLDIFKYNMLAEELIRDYGFERTLSGTNYILKWSKKDHIQIENKYEYFKASSYRNISSLNNNTGGYDFEKELDKFLKEMGVED
ncbi:MAG TPA: DUF4373 domain-containing protein [Gallicola sp.]|nr:DUF4373 domain-containing protein [Gallicola sp.]